jgi:hypothetical protein
VTIRLIQWTWFPPRYVFEVLRPAFLHLALDRASMECNALTSRWTSLSLAAKGA